MLNFTKQRDFILAGFPGLRMRKQKQNRIIPVEPREDNLCATPRQIFPMKTTRKVGQTGRLGEKLQKFDLFMTGRLWFHSNTNQGNSKF